MKNKLLILLFTCIIFLSCLNNEKQKEQLLIKQNKTEHLELLANGNLRYLKLNGTPYERGLTHGKVLKKEIQEIINLFKQEIAETTKEDPDKFIAKFLKYTDYRTSVNKWMPELMKELQGISKGSGVDLETIFMFQLGDEYWFNTKDILAHNCSSIGINKSNNKPSITAQNMDIPQFYHGFQTVLKISEPNSDKETMVLTMPGHLGITGMNNRLVSINCNTLMQLDYRKTGLPVTFIVRGVLDKNTQEEALNFINKIEHASGQNFIIGGAEKVYSLECSANKVAEYRPFKNSFFTYHTNHPMSNTDYSKKYLAQLKTNNKTIEDGLNECLRIKSFQQRFTENTTHIEIEDIKEVLRSKDNGSADVVSNNSTYASVIYKLSDKPKFIIAPGKPHEIDYIEIDFN
ncbi:C45 family peptidase [uncultured Lutibacter sp.]|uniref:C45 family autoproteolytic acyltransferase/hydolase n=1 Tax=uncultured Lutibacter sp. TaxID=437739 RepID=UPI00260AE7BD|nr:C45 family peptidase [uncultured Lutibacter sp.]